VDKEGIVQHRCHVPNLIETVIVDPEMKHADCQTDMIYAPHLPLLYALCAKNA
jgi:hypothetical protein